MRPHIWAIYAFYHRTHNIVGSDSTSSKDKINQLKQLQEVITSRRYDSSDLLWPALLSVMDVHEIPGQYLYEFLDGLQLDVRRKEISNRKELLRHCYQTSGTIGIMAAYVIGATKPKALETAKNIAIAMQLTRIMRDVGRDREHGKIYLPATDLKTFAVKKSDLEGEIVSKEFVDLLKDLKALVMSYYHDGRDGIKYLPDWSRRWVKTALRLSMRTLGRIEENDFNVYNESARLSWLEKVIIILNTK